MRIARRNEGVGGESSGFALDFLQTEDVGPMLRGKAQQLVEPQSH